MILWILTVLFIICYYIYYYFKDKLDYFHHNDIPYLKGWPLFGNMVKIILRRQNMFDLVQEIYNVNSEAKYVGAFNFLQPVIVLRDLDLIKSITIKNFEHFQNHRHLFDTTLDPLFGGNLFSLEGDTWRETRNVLTPAFTSKKMKLMFNLMIDCGQTLVKYIEEQPEEYKKMLDTKDLFTKYTNDIIATCAFGINVDSLKNPRNDFYLMGKEITQVSALKTIKFLVASSFPKLSKLLKFKFISEKASKFFNNIISTTVATRDEKGISRPDMLQLMMNVRDKENKYLKMDITNMTAQAFIFFFGGFDTSSTQMCVIAHELAINPDIQKKLQDEVERVLKETNGNPTYEVINEMLYLDAVFNESMRLHTQSSSLDRMCTKAFELPAALPGGKPFTVQPGMNIWIPASMIHRDPKYYDNPNKFDPDRYYDKKISINDVTNLAFGIGPRSCIGNRFAVLETKILIFCLLSKFNFKPNKRTVIPLTYSKSSINLKAEGGYWLSLESKSKI